MRVVLYMALGVAVLLALKYGVFGLDAWNKTLHPGRFEPDGPFLKPFFGIFIGGTCGNCT